MIKKAVTAAASDDDNERNTLSEEMNQHEIFDLPGMRSELPDIRNSNDFMPFPVNLGSATDHYNTIEPSI